MSKPQLHSVLKLKLVRSIPRRIEAQNRIRGHREIDSSVDGVEVRDVSAVEQVEEVRAEFGGDSFVEMDRASDAEIKSRELRPEQRVSAQGAWTV
jgi:hypothetical protein